MFKRLVWIYVYLRTFAIISVTQPQFIRVQMELLMNKLELPCICFKLCETTRNTHTQSFPEKYKTMLTLDKFSNLMSCKIKSKLLITSKYLKEALFLRKIPYKYNCFVCLFCGYISLSILMPLFSSLFCICVFYIKKNLCIISFLSPCVYMP